MGGGGELLENVSKINRGGTFIRCSRVNDDSELQTIAEEIVELAKSIKDC